MPVMGSGAAFAAMMRSDNMKKSYDGLPLERITSDPRDNAETLETSYGGYSIEVHYLGYSATHHCVVSVAIVRRKNEMWHFFHPNSGTETRRQVAEWLIDYVRLVIDEGNVNERNLMKGYPQLEEGMVLKDPIAPIAEETPRAKPKIEIKALEDCRK